MHIPFVKMQGTGNDFIIINNQTLKLTGEQLSALSKQYCQRKLSLGADALMVVDYPQQSGDFRMRFYNADGSEAEMCGNGARCIARYAFEHHLAPAVMTIETIAGLVPARRLSHQLYTVELNAPTVTLFDESIAMGNITKVDYVELGDPGIPHLVVHYPSLAEKSLSELKPLAKRLRHWERLPKGANVNFYEILPDQQVLVRTFERGVEDFTLACGTGSGSTAYVLLKKRLLSQDPVTLQVLGGELHVSAKSGLHLSGLTTKVAEGTLWDEATAKI